MSILCKTSLKTGLYRSIDDIKNFKIRIKITKIRSGGLQTIDSGPHDEEECVFQWQQKVFSKSEVEFYSKETNCVTNLEKKYYKDIKKSTLNSSHKLFSYIEGDEMCQIEENVTTEIRPQMSYLYKEMLNLKLQGVQETTSENKEGFDLEQNLKKNINQPFAVNHFENMIIMADLGTYDTETNIWLKSEHILCNLKYDTKNQMLYIYPDFSKKPYSLEIGGDGKNIYEYYIDNLSKEKDKKLQENELDVVQKILKRNQIEKNQIIGTDFQMPPRNKLRMYLFFEILKAKNFEYDDIYVQYNIELPEFWNCEEKYLCGSTHTCKTRGPEKEAYFGHNFEICLEYNLKEFNKKGCPRVPYIYFQVISRDFWDRYRCEGISYKAIPTFQSGFHNFELKCLRVCPKNYIGDLRRSFIGDYGSVDDITWTGLPKDYDNATINKYGVKTIGTGTIEVRLNVLNQSKHLARRLSQSEDRVSNLEGIGASLLVKSVEEVVLAFRKAQERMQRARKLVLDRKKVEDIN